MGVTIAGCLSSIEIGMLVNAILGIKEATGLFELLQQAVEPRLAIYP